MATAEDATLLDVLDKLVVPFAIFALGALLPWAISRQRRWVFFNLIDREFGEMAPNPKVPRDDRNGGWAHHLDRRFVHEQIVLDPSVNREFLLSLPADLVYELTQMWINFEKAFELGRTRKTKNAPASTVLLELDDADTAALAEYAREWLSYLEGMCRYLDHRAASPLVRLARRFAPRVRSTSTGLIRRKREPLLTSVYGPWEALITQYHSSVPGMAAKDSTDASSDEAKSGHE